MDRREVGYLNSIAGDFQPLPGPLTSDHSLLAAHGGPFNAMKLSSTTIHADTTALSCLSFLSRQHPHDPVLPRQLQPF
jgi:hypothetical protein